MGWDSGDVGRWPVVTSEDTKAAGGVRRVISFPHTDPSLTSSSTFKASSR